MSILLYPRVNTPLNKQLKHHYSLFPFKPIHGLQGSESSWWTFLQTLPYQTNTPILWTDKERSTLLRGSSIQQEAAKREISLKQEWATIETLCAQTPEKYPSGTSSCSRLQYTFPKSLPWNFTSAWVPALWLISNMFPVSFSLWFLQICMLNVTEEACYIVVKNTHCWKQPFGIDQDLSCVYFLQKSSMKLIFWQQCQSFLLMEHTWILRNVLPCFPLPHF